MASDQDIKDDTTEEVETATADDALAVTSAETDHDAPVAGGLGAARYVHAAFFLLAILGAYVFSKVLVLAWGALAEWPAAVRAVPQIVAYAEDQREGITLVVGAAAGTIGVVQAYRKETVRGWADSVAGELSRVTWPTRETVLNGTVVVVLASAIATVYVTILDRFWSFLTTLVYGA
jgi:preprotein translocase subunit SecE